MIKTSLSNALVMNVASSNYSTNCAKAYQDNSQLDNSPTDISQLGQLSINQDISPPGQLPASQDISPPGRLPTSQDISQGRI